MMNRLLPVFLLVFIFICPGILAQSWEQVGPRGGYFKDFVVHPSNPLIAFAGSDDSGGLWKTTNGGVTWTLVTEELPDMTGWHLEPDPGNPAVIYACDAYGRYGVIKSADGGNQWTVINSGLTPPFDYMVSSLAVSPLNSSHLWISTGMGEAGDPPRPGNGVFKSTDAGNSWIASGLQGTTVSCLAITSTGKLFAGTEFNGLQRSTDGGLTWSQVAAIPSTKSINQVDAAGEVVAVSADSNGIYLSKNDGITFSFIGQAGEFNFDLAITSLSTDTTIFSTSTVELRKYKTSTQSWTTVPGLPPTLLGIGIGGWNSEIYYATFNNSEIWKSSDGGNSFQPLQASPPCTELSSVTPHPLDSNELFVTLLGTYSGFANLPCISHTTNAGNTWVRKGPVAHGLCLTFAAPGSTTQYCGTFGNGLFKSSDAFDTFTNIRPGNLAIGDVNVDAADSQLVFISELNLDNFTFGLFKSTDGGASFSLVLNQVVNAILNSPADDSLFVATENGLFISPDNGATWTTLYSGLPVLSLARHQNLVYAGFPSGEIIQAYPSYDDLTGPWGVTQVKTLLFHQDTMYAGLNGAEQDTSFTLRGGVWYSSDLGLTWNDMTSNLTTTHCYGDPGLAFAGNQLYMASYSGGLFRWSNGQGTGIAGEEPRVQFNLFPNPAASQVRIRLEEATMPGAVIKILDLRGNVRVEIPASANETDLSTLGLAPGWYVVTLEAGGQVRSSSPLVIVR